MLIEIKKQEKLSGEIYYNLYINNAYETNFLDDKKAYDHIDLLKENLKKGLPKEETIHSETI